MCIGKQVKTCIIRQNGVIGQFCKTLNENEVKPVQQRCFPQPGTCPVHWQVTNLHIESSSYCINNADCNSLRGINGVLVLLHRGHNISCISTECWFYICPAESSNMNKIPGHPELAMNTVGKTITRAVSKPQTILFKLLLKRWNRCWVYSKCQLQSVHLHLHALK